MRTVIPFLTNRSLSHGLWSDFDDIFANLHKDYFWTENDKSLLSTNSGLQETEKFFLLSLDLPGMRKEDIKIESQDGKLTISGERKSYGKFRKVYSLDSHVDADGIEAHYENGVLEISLPKSATKVAKTIEIQSGKEGFLNRFLPDRSAKVDAKKA